jgi:Ca-activated chloride channel family protein
MSRVSLAVIICLLLGSVLLAQLKVDVALVNIVATVTDARGQYVPGLTAEDFVVEEDGEVQTVSHFDQSDDVPVSVGIVLDSSGSMERKIATAATAVERFIRTIHEDDDIFLLSFSDWPTLRQDFTDDRDRLGTALRRLNVEGGTALYDAVDEGLRKLRRGKHEKKAILLISDGEDTSSRIGFQEAELRVRESEMLVYALGISPASDGPLSTQVPIPRNPRQPRRDPRFPAPPSFPFPFPSPFPFQQRPQQRGQQRPQAPGVDTVDMQVLNAFADASGGKAWLLSGSLTNQRRNEIQDALDEIAAELRNQYTIGYYPPHAIDDGKWHQIEIRPKNPRYHVRSRKEYFGG